MVPAQAHALSQADCVAAIAEHSAGFASAAHGRLDATVEHCPGWSVADLVAHVVDVTLCKRGNELEAGLPRPSSVTPRHFFGQRPCAAWKRSNGSAPGTNAL